MAKLLLHTIAFLGGVVQILAGWQGNRLLHEGWTMCGNISNGQVSCMDAVVPGTVLTTLLRNRVFGFREEDIFYEDNLAKIPDIEAVGSEFYTWSFSKDIGGEIFSMGTFERLFIVFRGINYRANIGLCGVEIENAADTSGMFAVRKYEITSIVRHSKECNKSMLLTVQVFPPDIPGSANGGQGGDHEIARNGAVMQSSAGWDWIQGTPDRNTGIWDEVSLEAAFGAIAVSQPAVHTVSVDSTTSSAVLQGELTLSLPPADLTSTSAAAEVLVYLRMQPTSIHNSSSYLSTTSVVHINLTGPSEVRVSLPVLKAPSARLWWPHSLGPQNLYSAETGVVSCQLHSAEDSSSISICWDAVRSLVSASPHRSVSLHSLLSSLAKEGTGLRSEEEAASLPPGCRCQVSDSIENLSVGIRTVESFVSSVTQGRAFRINGSPLFVTGGNWICSEQLLRLSRERYLAELEMHRRMGLAMVRVWGGGLTERPDFYAACDALGLLVYQEFWMTGDNNGRWAGSYEWPDDHDSYLVNARDAVLLLRHHPSLVLWAAGNELHPADSNPPPDILSGLRDLLRSLDPDSEFIASSMAPQSADFDLFDADYALAPQDGPYGILLPSQWYSERNPGLSGAGYATCPISFQPETGSVSTPVLRSLQRFLSPSSLRRFPSNGNASDQNVDDMWTYHKYIPYTSSTSSGNYDHIYAYGEPVSAGEYALRAQLVQYQQYRALFEGFRLHQWSFYTAVLMWKSQSPWPSLRGALYDYYLAATGGYFGVRAALSSEVVYSTALAISSSLECGPEAEEGAGSAAGRFSFGLHVQLNPATLAVSLVNSLPCASSRAEVRTTVVALNGSILFSSTQVLPEPLAALEVFTFPKSLPVPKENVEGDARSPVYLYRLELFSDEVSDRSWPGSLCDSLPAHLDKPYLLQINDYYLSANTLPNEEGQSSEGEGPDYRLLGDVRNQNDRYIHLEDVRAICLNHSITVGRELKNRLQSRAIDLFLTNSATNSLAIGVSATLLTAIEEGTGSGSTADDRVLPSFYSDGFFTLLPGQQTTVHIEFGEVWDSNRTDSDRDRQLYVLVEGWNVHSQVIPVFC